MSRLIQRGEAYDFTNTGREVISAGTVETVGYLIGVVINDIPPGEMGALAVNGVWEVPKYSSAQFDAGDAVYWNTSGGYATDDDTKLFMGFAWTDAIPNTTEVKVKLLPDVAGGKGPQGTGGGESDGNPVTWEYVDGIGQGVAPEYESDVVYEEDDFVYYVGKFYKRTSSDTGESGVSPIDQTNGSTYWTEIVLSDELLTRISAGSAQISAVATKEAPAFTIGTDYGKNGIVAYNGKYYLANGTASSNPVTQGWSETTLSEWVTTKIGDAVGTKNRAIENAVDGAVTLATNGGAVSISFDTAAPNIVHSATLAIGNNFDPAIWGQNIVEFEMIYTNAQAATALTWNGSAVTWIEGSATDLTAGRHLLRVRIIPQLDISVPGAILVEYVCELPTTFE